jgi:exosortase/archaeosortase family protein
LNNPEFTIVVLTLNEEKNLPKLLCSIQGLGAKVYIVDSGSTDDTLKICAEHQIDVYLHKFENHPKQWDFALNTLKITTPWIIGLDADQTLSPQLLDKLRSFRDQDYSNINGIYFNRKYIFKGQWIRHGGHYPMYLLKMFRNGNGYSDLTERMDHRFMVHGNTRTWKREHIIEENVKENEIAFWIKKHNGYSSLLAEETRHTVKDLSLIKLFSSKPNERKLCTKNIWNALPLYVRPCLYFVYRLIFQLGFLDRRQGVLFHFLQGFWFRIIVDMKIDEREKKPRVHSSSLFVLKFLVLFGIFYGFNILFIAITAPGGWYIAVLDEHLNYIKLWRKVCLSSTAYVLNQLDYPVTITDTTLQIKPDKGFKIVYSCLGYGIMSVFAAFILSFKKSTPLTWVVLLAGLTLIHGLNILRLTLITLYWKRASVVMKINHHDLFNLFVYLMIGLMIIIWIRFTPKNYWKYD